MAVREAGEAVEAVDQVPSDDRLSTRLCRPQRAL